MSWHAVRGSGRVARAPVPRILLLGTAGRPLYYLYTLSGALICWLHVHTYPHLHAAAVSTTLALELVRDPGLPSECVGRVHEATCADVVAEAAVAEASVAIAVAAMAALDD